MKDWPGLSANFKLGRREKNGSVAWLNPPCDLVAKGQFKLGIWPRLLFATILCKLFRT